MSLSELDLNDFRRQLADGGVIIETGPFTFRITCHLPDLADALRLFYGDFPLGKESEVDFHLVVRARRFSVPRFRMAEVFVDGRRLFAPFPFSAAIPNIEWALNWWIYTFAHNYLLIHAGTISRAGQVLILSGVPGSGKSTLCAELVAAGWRLLSDELALVEPRTGSLHATARPIALKNQSIEIIAQRHPEATFGPIAVGTVKGTIAHLKTPRASIDECAATGVPRWVCFPRYEPAVPTRLEPLTKARALMELAENAFNYRTAGATGFHALTALVDRCECYRLVFSSLDGALAKIAEICGSDNRGAG